MMARRTKPSPLAGEADRLLTIVIDGNKEIAR